MPQHMGREYFRFEEQVYFLPISLGTFAEELFTFTYAVGWDFIDFPQYKSHHIHSYIPGSTELFGSHHYYLCLQRNGYSVAQ